MTFTAQLKRFATKAKKKPVEAQRKIFIELSSRIIQRTPVDTGRARANWNAAIGGADTSITDATDQSGSKAISDATVTAVSNGKGQTLYLTNSLPYIQRLEDGWSQQAAQGMVKLSALEFQQITQVVVRGL